ncbi:tetratricopeptide repeat protein [Novipirellula aureliae]|nr:tetratricopeptide repeat protein [Novipirellula aureliae]
MNYCLVLLFGVSLVFSLRFLVAKPVKSFDPHVIRRKPWRLLLGANPKTKLLAAVLISVVTATTQVSGAEESSEAAIAVYADAANFQTNGAIELAIESWKKFLADYPNDPMASKAAHYLGVCYMQQEEPDYAAAAASFGKALADSDYDLREESLANQGWCLYSAAGEAPSRDAAKLKETIESFSQLRSEFPKSQFLDRSLFYSGEAAYGLGNPKQAIELYNELLALPDAKESPLRCDALYARGVAYEELDQFDHAVSSFLQLLSTCDRNELITDVRLRLGDTAIMRKDYDEAITQFDQAFTVAENDDDKSYALFRQAYALVQADRSGEAAEKYEQLLKEYPNSANAAAATLASAQSTYRSGDADEAAKRFERVLELNLPEASTEAAHWLSRIYLSKNDPETAQQIVRRQLAQLKQQAPGAGGPFELELKLDLAEALSMNPDTIEQSFAEFHAVYKASPDGPTAPRALYNSAFSSLQLNRPEQAIEMAAEFIDRFPDDMLAPDVRFIQAEGLFFTQKYDQAAAIYQALLIAKDLGDEFQRPLWVLRAAAALNADGELDQSIELLRKETPKLPQPDQRAEAQMMLGQALMASEKYVEAGAAFKACHTAAPDWPRADEALLLAGQSFFLAGQKQQAQTIWRQIIDAQPDGRMADQSRYKLAQIAANQGDPQTAIELYDKIIASKADPGLMPYAFYSRALLQMDEAEYQQAIDSLDTLLSQYEQHPIRGEALLARGMSYRNLNQLDPARSDLEDYLALQPTGVDLGHGLYELALVDQKQNKPLQAAERLNRIVEQVPDYPSIDKVLYELGWSYRESEQNEAAVDIFTRLVDQSSDNSLTSEAAYYLGQSYYESKDWQQAAKYFASAAEKSEEAELSEKSLYRLGWSWFKANDLAAAESAFAKQAAKHPDGALTLDALMMVGESRFNRNDYQAALEAYRVARERIDSNDETSKTIRDANDRQVRELILLHGGQSAAQLQEWQQAIEWYDELRFRFPSTAYLAQVFYETGFAYQQFQDDEKALQMYGEVANNYRNVVAARARFMMGQIQFANKRFDLAIPEFQRVIYGFGAEKSAEPIKDWQAKSGFEAARCSEILAQQARTPSAKQKALGFATKFYEYVVSKHPNHELAEKSQSRLEALQNK